jgi:H+/Cl- antiporter ClcA
LYKTTIILIRHYLIGILTMVVILWTLNEFPNRMYFQLHLTEWYATIFSIPIAGLLLAKLLSNRLKRTDKGLYLYSFLTIFISWIFIFLAKALTVGLVGSIEDEISELHKSLVGFSIYQLWFYLIIGTVHGLIGGLFLKIDLKKNLEKIKNGTQQRI